MSIDNYIYLASLLEQQLTINILRTKIIRYLYSLVYIVLLVTPFTYCNPQSSSDTKNTVDLLTKLDPNTHYVTGMAFALVMNPVSSGVDAENPFEIYQEEKEGNHLIEV